MGTCCVKLLKGDRAPTKQQIDRWKAANDLQRKVSPKATGSVCECLFFPDPTSSGPKKNQPPGRNFSRFLSYIQDTKFWLDICIFTLTDDRIAQAILALFDRGVHVRIIADVAQVRDPFKFAFEVLFLQTKRNALKLIVLVTVRIGGLRKNHRRCGPGKGSVEIIWISTSFNEKDAFLPLSEIVSQWIDHEKSIVNPITHRPSPRARTSTNWQRNFPLFTTTTIGITCITSLRSEMGSF